MGEKGGLRRLGLRPGLTKGSVDQVFWYGVVGQLYNDNPGRDMYIDDESLASGFGNFIV